MAVNDVSNWWDVGEAPGLVEWCKKNVSDACASLVSEMTVTFESEDGAGDLLSGQPCLAVWSPVASFIPEEASRFSLSAILDDLVDLEMEPDVTHRFFDRIIEVVEGHRLKLPPRA